MPILLGNVKTQTIVTCFVELIALNCVAQIYFCAKISRVFMLFEN